MSSVTEKTTRMRAEDRRELLLQAATSVFGDYGYHGATTELVARAAGVSQPYVVRVFGSKETLFLEVLGRALDRLLATFSAALAVQDGRPVTARLGAAYAELITDRGLLLSLMHGFVLGREERIGQAARAGFKEVYHFLRHDAGLDQDEADRFLGGGMLLNTLIGVRMADDYADDAEVRELIECALPQKVELLLAFSAADRARDSTADRAADRAERAPRS